MRFILIVMACIISISCVSTITEQQVPEVPEMEQPIQESKLEVPENALISDLQVMDKINEHNWAFLENIQEGDLFFGDRQYLITTLPGAYRGMNWIRTACDSKQFTGETLVSFTANADVMVFVVYDDRLDRRPAWLTDYRDTGDDLVDSESSPVTLSIFGKTYAKGSVVKLGHNTPNGQTGGCIQYSIILMDSENYKNITFVPEESEKPIVQRIPWTEVTTMPFDWYKTEEGIRIGDNILLYQRDTGGWPKNIDMSLLLSQKTVENLKQLKNATVDSTIDNDATTYQIIYLARVYSASGEERFKTGALAGLEYLLKAQYSNGGWPMVYPLSETEHYYKYITFKNNAMINVLELFTRILGNDAGFIFVGEEMRTRIKTAVDKGVECILAAQIKINGNLTAWCAQYDPETLQPAGARAYEPPALNGLESMGIVRFLMQIEKPSPGVITAVQAAITWFTQARIEGIRPVTKQVPAFSPPKDIIAEADPSAPPVWGRFYDLKTGKIFFCTRDGVKKATLAEVEHERRIGYSFYTYEPATLLDDIYPEWQAKHAP